MKFDVGVGSGFVQDIGAGVGRGIVDELSIGVGDEIYELV